jgi:hypothetical protein
MNVLPPPDPGLSALLVAARAISPVPDIVRARAMGRARAIIRARSVGADEGLAVTPSIGPPPSPARFRITLLIALFFGIGIGGVGTALAIAVDRRPSSEVTFLGPLAAAPPNASVVPRPAAPRSMTSATAGRAATLKPSRRTVTARESFAAELDLLHRAQAELGRRNFGAALALIAEHARRFPNGRLAEEREALRVRSLAASGRVDEARHAGVAFSDRFPRSVLVPRLQETPPRLQ